MSVLYVKHARPASFACIAAVCLPAYASGWFSRLCAVSVLVRFWLCTLVRPVFAQGMRSFSLRFTLGPAYVSYQSAACPFQFLPSRLFINPPFRTMTQHKTSFIPIVKNLFCNSSDLIVAVLPGPLPIAPALSPYIFTFVFSV